MNIFDVILFIVIIIFVFIPLSYMMIEILKYNNDEIERLNNNWNELEQWIEKQRDKWEKYNPDCFVYYQSILDRMEELKGADKE